jgi:hypothetical protein
VGEDRLQGGDEAVSMPGVRFNFVRQGDLRLDMSRGHETFAGRQFGTGRVHADGRAQITRWLNVAGTLERADAVFYDPTNPFPGIQFTRNLNLEWQPNARLAHNLSYNFVRFERADGEKVFAVTSSTCATPISSRRGSSSGRSRSSIARNTACSAISSPHTS